MGDKHTEVDEQYHYLGLLMKLKIPLLRFRSVRGGRKERGITGRKINLPKQIDCGHGPCLGFIVIWLATS